MSEPLTILLSSAGRRVELMQCFRSAAAELGCRLQVVAVDVCPELSAACRKANVVYVVPRCEDGGYVDRLLEICAKERVSLLIPTIDPELELLAANRERFESRGVRVCISHPEVVSAARDKLECYRMLSRCGLATPRTDTVEGLLSDHGGWRFPVVLKPRKGSSSIGMRLARDMDSVRCADIIPEEYIAQEHCSGVEYTVNLFFDGAGLQCAIPHRRVEVRAGEVSKAVTERVPALSRCASVLEQTFAGRAFGPLCFQAILTSNGPAIIDVNARFGGGYPLAQRARANFARWLLEGVLGLPSSANDHWEAGLGMIRYDSAVYFPASGSRARAEGFSGG